MMSFRKILSVIATTALLFNSIAPYSLAMAQTVEPSPTPTETATPTDSATLTASPTAQPTDTPTATASPADQPTVTPSDIATPTNTPTDTPVATQAPESNPTTTAPPDSTQLSASLTASPSVQPTVTPVTPVEHGNITTTVVENIDLSTITQLNSNVDTATVTTDKADYHPTDVVLITGTGFLANKDYTIEIVSTDQPPVDFKDQIKADSSGNISYAYQLDGTMRPNYTVYVKDGERIVATTTFTDPVQGSYNLDQGKNGKVSAPISPIEWTNQNLNDQHAHYQEGQSVAYRVVLTDLPTGVSNTVKIEWDIRQSSKNAIDYITGPQRIAETVDPTVGVAGLGAATYYLIPTPTANATRIASFNALPTDNNNKRLWAYNVSALSFGSYVNGSDAGANTSTSITFTFTPTNPTVVLAWGGHIAAEADWGAGNGATALPGSPYHTRILQLCNGTPQACGGGNQDRSLSASAVTLQPQGSITLDKVTNPSQDPTSFGFTTSGFSTNTTPSLTDTTTPVTWSSLSDATYTITEAVPADWTLTGRVCTGQSTSVVTNITNGVSIALSGGETINCAFTNTRNTGTIIVDKQVDTNGDGTYEVTTDAGANALGFQWGLDLESPARNFGNSLAVTTNVTHSISEASPAGYHFVGSIISTEPASCNGINPNPNGYPVVFSIPNPGNNTRHILLCNAANTGTIELKKVWSGTGGQTTLNIGTQVGSGDVDTQQTGTNGTGPLTTGQNTVNTGTYYVSETGGLTDYTSSLACFNDANNNGLNDDEAGVSVGEGNGVQVGSGQHVICTFTNTRNTGTLTIHKQDQNGNSQSDVTISISSSETQDSQPTDGNGDAVFANIPTGDYTIEEDSPTNYHLTDVSGDCSWDGSISVNLSTDGASCTLVNTRDTGTIIVHKKVDDGSREYTTSDSGANEIGFRWGLDDGDADRLMGTSETVTSVDNHTVDENDITGYTFTGWYLSGDEFHSCTNPTGTNRPISFSVAAGGTASIVLCNQLQQKPSLTITKTNSNPNISAGAIVTYTLTIENTGNVGFDNVVVTDILPGGFTYVDGSTTGGAIFVPPQVGPKLTWNTGPLASGATMTITYQVQTNGGLSDGDYKNFATCTAAYGDNQTKPCNQTDSTVTIGHSVSYGGNLGQVLGISTELPATGNPTGLLALALGTLTVGLYMRGFGGGKKSKRNAKN